MVNTRVASLVIASALAASACSIDVQGNEAVVTEERRFPAGNGAELVLRTFDGSIDVEVWDSDEVLVRIDRRAATGPEAQALEVRTTHEGNRIVVDAPEAPDDGDVLRIGAGRSVSFVVRAPRRITLDARTGDGSISAVGLEGAVRLNSGDGSVRAERVGGQLTVHTGDGSISVADASGAVDVDSGDGSIDVRGRLESVRVRSGDGSVHVEADEGSVLKSDWSVTTGDGAISLQVPANLDADVDAESGDGRVTADWATDQPRRSDEERQSFRGRLGNGGQVLRLRTGDGSIEIRRQ